MRGASRSTRRGGRAVPLALPAVLAAAVLVAGCGGNGRASAKAEARETVETYFAALSKRDFAAACAKVSPSFHRELADWSVRNQPGLESRDCPTIASRIAAATDGRLVGLQRDVRVRSVELGGDRATAQLGPGQTATLRQIDGRWLIERLDFRGAAG